MKYDVALSFAGEDRKYVEAVATELKRLGVKVFYDKFETVNLWGKDLYAHLQNVYQKEAKYTVIFISKHYAEKLWTNHERKMAQARAFKESSEYILPARFDDTEIEGILPTVGFIDLRRLTASEFSQAIINKLNSNNSLHFLEYDSSNLSKIVQNKNSASLKVQKIVQEIIQSNNRHNMLYSKARFNQALNSAKEIFSLIDRYYSDNELLFASLGIILEKDTYYRDVFTTKFGCIIELIGIEDESTSKLKFKVILYQTHNSSRVHIHDKKIKDCMLKPYPDFDGSVIWKNIYRKSVVFNANQVKERIFSLLLDEISKYKQGTDNEEYLSKQAQKRKIREF